MHSWWGIRGCLSSLFGGGKGRLGLEGGGRRDRGWMSWGLGFCLRDWGARECDGMGGAWEFCKEAEWMMGLWARWAMGWGFLMFGTLRGFGAKM